jgi:hypothetical protein
MAIGIICIIVSCIILIIGFQHIHNVNTEIDRQNTEAEVQLDIVKNKITTKQELLNKIQQELTQKIVEEEKLTEKLQTKTKEFNQILEQNEKISNNAYANYAVVLEQAYQKKEQDFDKRIANLNSTLENAELDAQQKMDEVAVELEKLITTYEKSREAILKERRAIAEKQKYSISLIDEEKSDIKILNDLKPKLHQPRILSMLIWQTYIQKKMKQLIVDTLGTTSKTGIYKITNFETSEAYIGQAVDVGKRFLEHAKCGVGIDTPAQNKLYKAIQSYGIHCFSWELIEECSKEELNKKERYYIKLFDTVNTGYNILKGNKT